MKLNLLAIFGFGAYRQRQRSRHIGATLKRDVAAAATDLVAWDSGKDGQLVLDGTIEKAEERKDAAKAAPAAKSRSARAKHDARRMKRRLRNAARRRAAAGL